MTSARSGTNISRHAQAFRILLTFAGFALAFGCHSEQRVTQGSTGAPPVILISIDTLRSDHLPAYGYRGVETPHIDSLRADSILWQHAYAHVPLTLPSHLSVLTGLLPFEHAVRNNIGYRFDATRHPSLPRLLKENGYDTGAAVSAYVLRGSTGISADFDSYDDAIESRPGEAVGQLQRGGEVTVALANRWIESRKEKPFFYFLHLFEPHTPYAPPPDLAARFPNQYDGDIALADRHLGSFLSFLKSAGIYDRALVVLFSDHGEGLMDHGEDEHGIFLYREALQVPLLVKLPGRARAGETIGMPAQLIDIFPTIAAALDLKTPPALRGTDLLGETKTVERAIYGETLYPRIHLGWSALRSMIIPGHHYIEAPKPELYDLASDPGERVNVLSDERRIYARLREQLATYPSEQTLPSSMDPDEAKKLAALGYLGGTAQTQGPVPDPKDRIGDIAALKRAARLSADGDHSKAIDLFDEVLRQNPGLTDAWTQLATTQERAGQLVEAVASYKKVIELSPVLAGEHALGLSGILLKLGKFDDAEAHARLASSSSPGACDTMLARIAVGRGDLNGALLLAQRAAKDHSYRYRAAVLQADILSRQGKLEEGLRIVSQTADQLTREKLAPIESLELVRGDLFGRMNRPADAEKAFRREIASHPSNLQAYANLALVLFIQGRNEDAYAALLGMEKANPGKRSAQFASKTLAELGDARGAAEWRRKAARYE